MMSLLERCLQLGAIAKTVYHLLYLVRVIQTEVSPTAILSIFVLDLSWSIGYTYEALFHPISSRY